MASASIDQALITYALTKTAITGIVSRRVYHIKAPESAPKPFVVQRIVAPSNESERFGEGRMGQPLVQWLCVGDDSKAGCDAFLAAHAIMDTFANYQGTMDGVTVDNILITGPKEIPADKGEIHCIVEGEVHYIEP